LGALLAQNAFRAIKRKLDPEVYGGAPMLGFKGVVMKAHGSAREKAIVSAIRVTKYNIQHHVSAVIEQAVAQANERLGILQPAPATA
jgi:glycerol-3-phosphate acyltransferase PlsX